MSTKAARSPHSSGDRGTSSSEYRESLRTPWWWYPIALLVAAILAAEFHVADYSLTDWVPFVVMLPFSVAVVWWLGRSKLIITSTELSIRGAHISRHYISAAVAMDARTLRRVIGREGDPQAFVSIRPWIGPGVQLQLDDPDDPTPYWVVSSRHPNKVADLLRSSDASDAADRPDRPAAGQ